MKKVITLVLILTIVLSLGACTGSTGKEETLQIGYAKVSITPNFQVSLGGYGDADTRKNTDGMADYIYITCIAAKEADNTVLFFTMDASNVGDSRADSFRELISPEVGVPGENMFFGGTHTHNAPDDTDTQYGVFLKDKVVKAAKDAIADLSPATISAATTQTTGMTFVRHYEMEDGTYSGSNFGNWSIKIVGHAGPADESMLVVKFDRIDESKKDVVLVNFQAHNDHAKELGYNLLSAGYVAPLRDELEAKSGCEVAFFMGASGNLNPSSRIESEKHKLSWKEYGQKLGQIAYEAMNDMKPVGGSGIAVSNYIMDAEVDHSWDHRILDASRVNETWSTSGKDAATALAHSLGFSSAYHAMGVVTKCYKKATEPVRQSVFRIHNLGFAVGPYEMFCENGVNIKNASPFEYTCLILGNRGYIPSQKAYDYQSYESHLGTFAKGTAEKLESKYIEMLKEIQ